MSLYLFKKEDFFHPLDVPHYHDAAFHQCRLELIEAKAGQDSGYSSAGSQPSGADYS